MATTNFPYGLGVGAAQNFELAPFVEVNLGAPIAADNDAIIYAATGSELPNGGSITYTTANIGTSPCDGANQTWVLDVPRNIYTVTTHSSSVVAMTVLVQGQDQYGVSMSEQISVPATGTSQTVQGKKAFKKILSITITATGDATTNTFNLGFGDVLGLPYIMARNTVVKEIENTGAASPGTIVVADTSTPSATTGDVRGTYDPASACNGSKTFRLIYMPTSLTENGEVQA